MAIIKSASTFRVAFIFLLVAQPLTLFTGCDSSTESLQRRRPRTQPALAAVSDDSVRHNAANVLDTIPLRFEQAPGDTRFLARGAAFELSIQPAEAVMHMRVAEKRESVAPAPARTPNLSPQKAEQASPSYGTAASLHMQFVGANRSARLLGESKLTTRSNYFLGNDASRWSKALPNYARVRVAEIYRDIDVVYYGTGRQVEYDFHVAPGANYRAIRLRFTGAQRMTIDESGDLVLETTAGQVRQKRPVAYQVVEGSRREIPSRFIITAEREVRFFVDRYDEQLPLVIDPVLSYSTLLRRPRSEHQSELRGGIE